jgi:hypothetical protein
VAINQDWKPDEIAQSMKDWLQDSSNRELLVDSSRQEIEDYLQGRSNDLISVAMNLDAMSSWYLTDAVAALLEQRENGLTELYRAHYYGTWHVRILARLFSDKPKPQFSLNHLGITLARSIALGLFDEAQEIGRIILGGLKSGLVHGASVTWVGVFMLHLFGSWQQIEVWMPEKEFMPLGGYKALLASWRTEDASLFTAAALEACDFHTQISGDLIDGRIVDFWRLIYRIYPVEILAVLRLREAQGLSLPPLPHPLMDGPLGRLYPVLRVEPDNFLATVIKRMQEKSQPELS